MVKYSWSTLFYMKYYTTRQTFFIPSYTIRVEETEKIDNFFKLLEKSGVCDLIHKCIINDKNEKGGRPIYNPYDMLASILFCFAFNKATLRTIEEYCTYDLRVIYIMQNQIPTYKTIGNFINKYIVPNRDEIYSRVTKVIFEECKQEMDILYIDGSKFEANCNKYKFVWKPTTFHTKLTEKIKLLLSTYELDKDIKDIKMIEASKVADKLVELNNLLQKYDLTTKQNKNHKKAYETLSEYLTKCLEYEEKERICGPNRNSYYKTDYDATAMCLKEDYYSGLGSNMHAGYNVQLSVAKGLITSYIVTQSRNDLYDFIQIIECHYKMYNNYPKSICADSGYGSLENYKYLKEHNIKNFVKYYTWQGNVSGKNPSRYVLNDNDTITCLNGNIGYKHDDPTRHPKNKKSIFYKVQGCQNCDFKIFCKRFMKDKDTDDKIFEVNIELMRYVQESLKNLLSSEGIEMRVNRSSQVEGAFGVIKQDIGYTRLRRTSMGRVSTEIMLVCLGYNIRKLFRYYDGNAKFDYWVAPNNLNEEKFKKPRAKILSNKASKVRKKSINEKAKERKL